MNGLDAFNTNRRAAYDDQQGLQDLVTRKQAGAALSQGDYGGAASTLYNAGDLSGGAGVQKMEQGQQDRADERAGMEQKAEADKRLHELGFLKDSSVILGKIPDTTPNQDIRRKAFSEKIAPALKMQGMPDEMIAQIAQGPLDDVTLQAFGGQIDKAIDELQVVNRGNGAYDVVSKRTGDAVRSVDPFPEYKERDPEKQLLDVSVGGQSDQPRNMRNNNPGNIKDGPFAQSLPGYVGSDGTFAKFADLGTGTKAQVALLTSYGKRGIKTVQDAINRWAPASDNNDPVAYAKFVANELGVSPTQQIDLTDPVIASDMASAIQQFEGGPASKSNAPSGPRVVMDAQPKPNAADPPPESGLRPIGGGFYQDNLGRTYQRNSAGVMTQSSGIGDAEVKKAVSNVTGLNNVLSAIDQYDQAVKALKLTDFGPNGKYLGDPNKYARAKAAATDLMMTLKGPEVYNLGVITGPDLSILEGVVSDPAKFDTLVRNKQILPSLTQLSTTIGRKYKAERESFKALGGKPDALPPIYKSPYGKYATPSGPITSGNGWKIIP